MKVIKYAEINIEEMKKAIEDGKIIIYPTDTLYGIGCDATNKKAVGKIRELKKRDDKPFSVIAPSKKWIFDSFSVKNKNQIKEGPFTFILKIKKKGLITRGVNLGKRTLGVRLPNHPFVTIIQATGKPFVTTSVNLSGKKPVFEVKKIPRSMRKDVDIAIDNGVIEGSPSTLIDLTGKIPKIVRR